MEREREKLAAPDACAERAPERGAERAPEVRRFVDEGGVEWTAELKRPRASLTSGRPAPPMVLFWCADRACLATLAPPTSLGEMTTEELRRRLSKCLRG